MKKFLLLFSLLAMFLTSCEEMDYGDTPFHQMPLNREDSLVMVNMYKSMGCESWTKHKINLKKRNKWPGCYLKYDEANKEFRVEYIDFSFRYDFPEFNKPQFDIPEYISKLSKLNAVDISGTEDIKIGNISALTNCQELKNMVILYGNISEEELNEKFPKLSNTLTKLDLRFSELSGSLEWTGKLKNLSHLNLSNNNYEGTVPDVFKYKDCLVFLEKNNFSTMDWSYFTDAKVKYIPYLTYNKLCGEIPEEVFKSDKWIEFSRYIYPQQKGYGFINWENR